MSEEAKAVHIEVDAAIAGERLDRYLAGRDDMATRSQIRGGIDRGEVRVNGAVVKAGYALREGDVVEVTLAPPPPLNATPEDLPLDVLYEDAALIVVNKPSGMVVHPAPGHPRGTLVNALLGRYGQLAGGDEAFRPGIVHRLDRETSGVMVVARTVEAHAMLAAQFKAHTTERRYLALCHAPGLDDAADFDTLYGRNPNDRKRYTSRVTRGKQAITHVTVRERFSDGAALVACELETGRTHQIRVHLSEHHAPLLGDAVYGGRAASSTRLIERVALHAERLGLVHPDGHRLRFEREPPEDFQRALTALRRGVSWRA